MSAAAAADSKTADAAKPKPNQWVMTKEFATHFGAEWASAWNSLDLTKILSHYADDFEMSSPLIIERGVDPRGTLRGKEAVGKYWSAAMTKTPPLKFVVTRSYAGVNGQMTIQYENTEWNTRVVEILQFNADGTKIIKASACYA